MTTFVRVYFSSDDYNDRYFRSLSDAHTALTREGFVVSNPHWPSSWEIYPINGLPNYVVRAHVEEVETENV